MEKPAKKTEKTLKERALERMEFQFTPIGVRGRISAATVAMVYGAVLGIQGFIRLTAEGVVHADDEDGKWLALKWRELSEFGLFVANAVSGKTGGQDGRRGTLFLECLGEWLRSAKRNHMDFRPLPPLPPGGFGADATTQWAVWNVLEFLQGTGTDFWDDVHWGFPDSVIARVLSVSRQSVFRARKARLRKMEEEIAARDADMERIDKEWRDRDDEKARIEIMRQLQIDETLMDAVIHADRELVERTFEMLPKKPGTVAATDSPLGVVRVLAAERGMDDLTAARLILKLVPDIVESADLLVDGRLGIPPGSTSALRRMCRTKTADGKAIVDDVDVKNFGVRLRFRDCVQEISGRPAWEETELWTHDPVRRMGHELGLDVFDAVRILWTEFGRRVRKAMWSAQLPENGDEILPLVVKVGFDAEMRLLSVDREGDWLDRALDGATLSQGRVRRGTLERCVLGHDGKTFPESRISGCAETGEQDCRQGAERPDLGKVLDILVGAGLVAEA